MISIEQMISQNLKREIETSGISKAEIARQLGISKPTLSQYLNGKIFPSLVTFAKLCAILDCSSDDILDISKVQQMLKSI